MAVVTQLYFQIVEEINYMFLPFSGWAINRMKLEYRRKLIHYNVDYAPRMGEKDLILQWLGRCVSIYTRCGICASYDFICRVFCGFIDMWAGVVFRNCFTGGIRKRWPARSWLGRLHR
jgi:hypothetical protein